MTALDDHLSRLAEVTVLLTHVAPEVDPQVLPGATRRPFSDSTLARSCLVLSVSYFEGFLKDLTDEAFDTVLSSKVACERLSDHLRGRAISSHVQTLRRSENPSDNWRALSSLMEFGVGLRAGRPVTDDMLPRDEVKRAVTSIEPKKINEFFLALGDDDLNRGPMSVFGEKLRSLKQVRDNAVHGNEADLAPLSLLDVVECVDLLSRCARAMNARADALLERLCVA